MKTYEATEAAYKNGYKKGYEDGKKDAVKHGRWSKPYLAVEEFDIMGRDCSECGRTYGATKSNYCPNCGAKMDGEGIEVGKN